MRQTTRLCIPRLKDEGFTLLSITRDYQTDLLPSLKDPDEAKEYLNAALKDENPEIFLLALRDVVEANSSMSELAASTHRNRESLYKTLLQNN